MARIRFEPSGRVTETANAEETVAQAAERAGIPLDSVCGGRGKCGRCRVIITSKEAAITPEDAAIIPEADLKKGMRLACRMKIDSDLVVEIPAEFSRAGQLVLEDSTVCIDVEAAVRRVPLNVAKPSLGFQVGDLERVEMALREHLGDDPLLIPLSVMSTLPTALRTEGHLSAVLRGNELIDLVQQEEKRICGVAVDVGTTTIVAYLMDLESGEEIAVRSDMNPQVGHGDDVISRITYAMEEEGARQRLQSAAVDCINRLIGECCNDTGLSRKDIYEVVVAGNTAMHHMLFGLPTTHLAFSPYVPVVDGSFETRSRDIGVGIWNEGYVYSLPNIAGFVGADHVAVLLASRLRRAKRPKLVIDIGTNSEISVGDSMGISSASCAAGPAFEGGNIKFGMRGAAGAIDHVRISKGLEVSYTTIGSLPPRGVCGSGVVDAVAEMFRAGIVDRTGRIREELDSPKIVVRGNESQFILADQDESAIGEAIAITQGDVVQIQYAKAAMYAGAAILMERRGVRPCDLDEILLAGGFGNYVRPASARTIGLLPETPVEKIRGIGNAAGAGAKMALLNKRCRDFARQVAESVDYVELAALPEFEERFYSALYFPHHDTSAFPEVMSEISALHCDDLT